ncbi:hypothetical protein [Halocola ammonii]
MKISIRLLGSTILAALFWIAVVPIPREADHSDTKSFQAFESDQVQASNFIDLIFDAPHIELALVSSSGFVPLVVKFSPEKVGVLAAASSAMLQGVLDQCNSFLITFFLQLRKAELVYPFHSFW